MIEYKCAPIDGVDDAFVPALLKQHMALRYKKAVPDMDFDEAMEAALATWDTEWESDPSPRDYGSASDAVDSDLQHWGD